MIILGIGSISTEVIGVLFDNLRLRLRLCFGSISTVLVGVMLVNLRLLVFHVSP